MFAVNPFMKLALQEASLAGDAGEVPVGAVIEKSGKIIAKTHNLVRKLHDPTAHAEMLAIRKACAVVQSERLEGCNIYVSLEPCAMCAMAISYARLQAIYFACGDIKFGAITNGVKLFTTSSTLYKPEVYDGIMEEEAKNLMQQFFQNLRKQNLGQHNLG